MFCYNCGCHLSEHDFCTSCGADVSLYKKIMCMSNRFYNDGLEKAGVRDLTGAINSLRQSLKFNKNNIEARNLLGLVYFETGEAVAALSEWIISKNIMPENNIASEYIERLQQNANKLDVINQTIKKYNDSLQCCRKGSEDVAVIQLKKILNQNPKLIKGYHLLSLIYLKKEEYEKAIESFQQAIEAAGSLDSSCRLDVVGYRAEAKMKLGDYEGSLEDYNELIEAGYRLRDIYQLTGNVYLLMDDVDQALHCYQECLDIDNRNYEGYLTMADALKKAEAEEARKVVLNAALEVIPYEAKDWCYRGRIYLELEQTDEAFSAFEESYNKGYAQAGYYLGYCYELQGKSEEAINLYQEQIKHDPQDAGLYNQLSSCLVRQGEYQDALIMIQKGMQLADESQMADFLWNESICYEKMGNYDTAIEKLMSYLEQYPADKDAKKELAFLYSR